MGIKKFVKNVKQTLGLDNCATEDKKKLLKNLLKKLNVRKKMIKKSLNKSLNTKEEKELNEELDIICLQLKKGRKILQTLYTDKNKQKKS